MAAPVFTPAGEQRLAAYVDDASRSADDFQALLLEMVGEPMRPGRSPR
ncbi:MAG: hypothetical protein Q8M88_02290 [Phenylobacterium sp.]|nr:hypothetical protein [Phenylobacterium sp.]MDP3173248.1 hypothetical protein [Phenylobacterium sp.]